MPALSRPQYLSAALALARPARADELRSRQLRRVRRLAAHAKAEVPLYARALAGCDPERLRSLDDMLALPTFLKRDFRGVAPGDRFARRVDPRRLLLMRTSGTTGEPFEIRRTLGEELLVALHAHRVWRRLGRRRRDRWVRLAGNTTVDPSWQGRVVKALRRRFHGTVWARQPLPGLLADLRAAAPDLLTGYPALLAQVASEVGSDASGRIRPRLVVPGGEVLTPEMRAAIRAGFGGEVREIYGCYELGMVAWECPAGGRLHVDDDLALIEIVVDGRHAAPGEEGELVGTALHSYAMPFLRYRVGDTAVRGPSPCPCGYPGTTIERIRGRRLDYYPLPDGRLLHHYDLIQPALHGAGLRAWVARFQILQRRRDLFEIRLAPTDRDHDDNVALLHAELLKIVGPGVEVRIELVDELDFEPSGKFRVGRSLVAESESA
jgi:phenylacetate-CoA ligase